VVAQLEQRFEESAVIHVSRQPEFAQRLLELVQRE